MKFQSILTKTAALMVAFATNLALADGFVCQTISEDLNVSVFNKVNPADGTRTASQMIVSDPSLTEGYRTVAKFTAENETLETETNDGSGLNYWGKVDLRYNDSGRKGEYLLGTRLGEVAYVKLFVSHNYAHPVGDGDGVLGKLTVIKRNQEEISNWVTCKRYLKGE